LKDRLQKRQQVTSYYIWDPSYHNNYSIHAHVIHDRLQKSLSTIPYMNKGNSTIPRQTTSYRTKTTIRWESFGAYKSYFIAKKQFTLIPRTKPIGFVYKKSFIMAQFSICHLLNSQWKWSVFPSLFIRPAYNYSLNKMYNAYTMHIYTFASGVGFLWC